MRLQAGVTLPELLTTLAVLAVVAAAASPGFNAFRQDAERTTAVNSCFHALLLARSEALKQGRVVSLCPSLDGVQCVRRAPDWSRGWIVFIDGGKPAASDPVLARSAGWRHGRITANRPVFSYRPFGRSAVNGTILFCDPRGPAYSRAIIISQTGRPRIAQRDAGNKPLSCPRLEKL